MNVLFTSYKCNESDDIVQKIIKRWKKLNPTYIVKYYSDKDVKEFFEKSEYYETYKLMKNGVSIADFFRICYIHEHGGYWFDIDIEPFSVNIPKQGEVHLFDLGFQNISYMFIGGKADQPLFKETIKKVVKNINENSVVKCKHILDITGPRVIQNIVCNALNLKNIDGVLPGDEDERLYLKDTDYEFIYKKQCIKSHKTNEYIELQKRYNQRPYHMYNFI